MHVMKVFDHECVVNTVEGFGEVNKGKNSSMGDSLVNSSMDKVEESDQVVSDGCSLQATAVCRIKVRINNRKDPVT